MVLEAILAYAHLLAILTLVVFVGSSAALCRAEWLNAAALERLARVDLIYGIAAVAVLLTGLARVFWGVKGVHWYAGNWLLHLKVGMFVLVALMSIRPSLTIRRWVRRLRSDGSLPEQTEIRHTRARIMGQAHVIALIPLVAVFLARGFGGH